MTLLLRGGVDAAAAPRGLGHVGDRVDRSGAGQRVHAIGAVPATSTMRQKRVSLATTDAMRRSPTIVDAPGSGSRVSAMGSTVPTWPTTTLPWEVHGCDLERTACGGEPLSRRLIP